MWSRSEVAHINEKMKSLFCLFEYFEICGLLNRKNILGKGQIMIVVEAEVAKALLW